MYEGIIIKMDVTRIKEDKLNAMNYLDWRQSIELYLLIISMDTHMTYDPPTDASKSSWSRRNVSLFLQLCNSNNSEIIEMVSHCWTIKALMLPWFSIFGER